MNMIFKDKDDFVAQYKKACRASLGRKFEKCTTQERYAVLAQLVADKAKDVKGDARLGAEDKKRVFYFSMEFLIGRLLKNYLLNFGVTDIVEEGLADLGESLDNLANQERDPGLGNGGLGRLAACFMDSLASLGMNAYGIGIRYHYGLFRQTIVDGRQVEVADNWMENGYPWETREQTEAVVVNFGGHVEHKLVDGKWTYSWEDSTKVLAVPYDIPVVGYGGETINTLRLYSAEPVEERFDMDAFNRGDYSQAMKFKSDIEAISTLLYPDDSNGTGKLLRLKQEYMFVAAGLANIIRYFKAEHGEDWENFPKYIAIQTNDTHPSLCAPELLRILIDQEGLDWDTAWKVVKNSVSYTNHTILQEAMEKWPIDMFQKLLPRVYDFVEEIDRRYKESFPRDREDWMELLPQTAILWDGQVRTANLSIIGGHSVNGVASLHTEILKRDTLNAFYRLYPEMFNNKTNGITHRRFLAEANPSYRRLITEAIGDKWLADADELAKLEMFETDSAFLANMDVSKKENKLRLAKYIQETTGTIIDPNSIFDIQVKRFHAYKRQLLNLFKVMHLYNKLVENPNLDIYPTTFIFSGKAAQGYAFAKDVIRMVNSVADVVNKDPRVNSKIRVAFVPNFAVSNAQLIYPAADISEQISTAGYEASGTGNMKFMMNAAITLGTLDGANVEIAGLVGDEHIKIFGEKAEDISRMQREHSYFADDEVRKNPNLQKIVNQMLDETYAGLNGNFMSVYHELMWKNDEYFLFKDFESYVTAWTELNQAYKDRNSWNRSALHNTARSGFFSSDRTIREYARDIWGL